MEAHDTKMTLDVQHKPALSVSLPNLVLGSSLLSLPDVTDTGDGAVTSLPEEEEEELIGLCDHVDRGWSWAVLAAGTVGLFIGNGYLYSFGVFYLPLLDSLNEGEVMTSMVGSVLLGQGMVTGFFASILCDKVGCRYACVIGCVFTAAGLVGSFFANSCAHVIVCCGILTGMGLVFCYQAVHISVSHYFSSRRSFAIAVMQTGGSLGQVVWGPLTHYFIDIYSWRGAFLMLAGISLHLLVVGAILRPHRREYLHRKRNSGVGFDLTIFKNLPFDFLMLNTVMSSVILGMFFLHFPAYAVYSGTDIHSSALLLGIIGICGLFLKPLFGAAMNHPDVGLWTVYSISQTASGVITVLCPLFMTDFTGQVIFTVLFATYTTPYFAGHAAISLDSVEPKHYGAAMGLLQSFVGLGFFIGPIFGGWMFIATGSYAQAVQFAGGCFLVNTLLMFVVKMLSHSKQTDSTPEDDKHNDVTSCSNDDSKIILAQNGDVKVTLLSNGEVSRPKAASHWDIPVKLGNSSASRADILNPIS